MVSIVERWTALWKNIQQSPARLPTPVPVPAGHVDDGAFVGSALQPQENYFQVLVNETFLTYGRAWWTQYTPMAFVVSEFIYDGKEQAVPFVVGPAMMEKFGQQLPSGMLFLDTKVAGLHPYAGGGLTLSVILYAIQRDDYARSLLKLVEGVSTVLDFSTALGSYMKLAGVLLDGFESLLGLQGTVPLIGLRQEFNPYVGDGVRSGYFALIDAPLSQGEIDQLWVRSRRLCYGPDKDSAGHFRQNNYILYSLVPSLDREDETLLPIYPLWKQVVQEATGRKQDDWERARASLSSLIQAIALSPDLTFSHGQQLAERYTERAKDFHKMATKATTLGPKEEEEALPPELQALRAQAVDVLKL